MKVNPIVYIIFVLKDINIFSLYLFLRASQTLLMKYNIHQKKKEKLPFLFLSTPSYTIIILISHSVLISYN